MLKTNQLLSLAPSLSINDPSPGKYLGETTFSSYVRSLIEAVSEEDFTEAEKSVSFLMKWGTVGNDAA